MYLTGVSEKGRIIEISDDLSVFLEHGLAYMPCSHKVLKVAKLISFSKVPSEYKEGKFLIDDIDKTKPSLIISINHKDNAEEGFDIRNIDFKSILESSYKESNKFSLIVPEKSEKSNSAPFCCKILKDEQNLKVGYYKYSIFGAILYNFLIFTPLNTYTGIAHFSTKNVDENRNTLESLLNTIQFINTENNIKKEVGQDILIVPTFDLSIKESIGTFNITLPDNMRYVTKEKNIRNVEANKILIAVPQSYKKGIKAYSEAPLGIVIQEPVSLPLLEKLWSLKSKKTIETKIKDLLVQVSDIPNNTLKFNNVNMKDKIATAFLKEDSSNDSTSFWVIYLIFIFHQDYVYPGRIYLDCKKAIDEEFEKVISSIISKIEPCKEEELFDFKRKQLTNSLGNFANADGHIDAIKVSQLYSKDIIFNNDNEIEYNGIHHNIKGMQFNSTLLYKYPIIQENLSSFAFSIVEVVNYVENNENLMIMKKYFHKNLLNATRNNPITGFSLFDFCANHMLMISDNADNSYKVIIDQDLVNGIPQVCLFIAEFIRTLRSFNGIKGDFELMFASANNADSPVKKISEPVIGASLFSGMHKLSVKENDNLFKGVCENL